MKFNTREDWLNAAAAILIEEVISPNIDIQQPKMRYSLTAPKTATSKVLGECWAKHASADNTHEIFIAAALGHASSAAIIATLLHEQLHAYDNLESGHKAPFISLCKKVGLEGGRTAKSKASFTATKAGPELQAHIEEILETIGEIPHSSLNASENGKKKQKNRQKLVECTAGCGFKFRASQTMIDSMTSTTCLCCGQNSLAQGV